MNKLAQLLAAAAAAFLLPAASTMQPSERAEFKLMIVRLSRVQLSLNLCWRVLSHPSSIWPPELSVAAPVGQVGSPARKRPPRSGYDDDDEPEFEPQVGAEAEASTRREVEVEEGLPMPMPMPMLPMLPMPL